MPTAHIITEQSGSAVVVTAIGVSRQRMLAEPALLQRLGRSHQHDPGCDYYPDAGSGADFCLVATAVVRQKAPPIDDSDRETTLSSGGRADHRNQAKVSGLAPLRSRSAGRGFAI